MLDKVTLQVCDHVQCSREGHTSSAFRIEITISSAIFHPTPNNQPLFPPLSFSLPIQKMFSILLLNDASTLDPRPRMLATGIRMPAVPRTPPPFREESRRQGGYHAGWRRRAGAAFFVPRYDPHRHLRLLVCSAVDWVMIHGVVCFFLEIVGGETAGIWLEARTRGRSSDRAYGVHLHVALDSGAYAV